jgi:type II secretory pathway pseudopilin PulG
MARERNIFRNSGFTLAEVMISVAITIVVALGTLCYQYLSVEHSRISLAQTTATRIGQLLLEDWKSTGGDSDYDPVSLGLGFASPVSLGLPSNPGQFFITLDNQTFFIQLVTPSQIDQDTVANVKLLKISVLVQWRKDYTLGQGTISADDPQVSLTTYVRREG